MADGVLRKRRAGVHGVALHAPHGPQQLRAAAGFFKEEGGCDILSRTKLFQNFTVLYWKVRLICLFILLEKHVYTWNHMT